ncbi:hypothetical protein LXL04_028580 [Taraxacum kok-saghyz]
MDLCSFAGYKMFKFSAGIRVEVMGHSDGFLNLYFGATVIRDDQDKVLVGYEELIGDDGEKLEEQVKIEHIRHTNRKLNINSMKAMMLMLLTGLAGGEGGSYLNPDRTWYSTSVT